MASPITWRNVNGPDLTGAAEILGRSQDNFQNMFSGLQNVMDTARNTQIANQENQVRLNTEDFEAQLRKRFQTPEQLQAARQSGELDALRQQYGPYGLDTERTNAAAVDSLLSNMQRRQVADWEFQDARRDQEISPIVNEYLSEVNGLSADMNLRDRGRFVQEAFSRIDADTRLDEEGKNTLKSRIRGLVADQDNQFITRNNYFTEQKNLADLKAAEELAMRTIDSRFQARRQYDQAAKQGTEELASILNLSPSQLTDTDLVNERVSNLSPEAFQEYQAKRSELASMEDPTSGFGNQNQELFVDLVDRVGFTRANEMLQGVEQQTVALNDMSATAQQDVLKADREMEKKVRNNSFYKDEQYGQSPAEKVATLMEEFQSSGNAEDFWWWNNNEARNLITQAASGNFSLNGKDPAGEIPVGYIKAAVLSMRPGVFNDTTFREALEGVMGSVDIGAERKAYEDAKKQRETAVSRIRARDMGRLPGGSYQNLVRGLPTERPVIERQDPVPTPLPDPKPTVQAVPANPQTGFLGVPAAEQQIVAKRQAREQAREALRASVNAEVTNTGNAERINSLARQLDTRSRSMGYDRRNEVRQELLRALPNAVLENPEATDYLEDIPKFLLDRELKRRGIR